MSDNTKQKKAIRERMTRTGETYSTARMHILSANGGGLAPSRSRIEALVHEVITLSRADDAPQASAATPFRVTKIADVRSSDDRSLLDYLLALAAPDLCKMEVLYYAGRDDDRVLELATTLHRDTHERTALGLAEKAPVLAMYLQAGLLVAAEQGVDLDGPWVDRAVDDAPKPEPGPTSDYDRALAGMHAWDARIPVGREQHDHAALLRTWAKREGAKESRGHVCLTRLAHGRCNGLDCDKLPGRDHTSMWTKAGRPHIYVTQPYVLHAERLDEMFRVCHRLGLTVRVDSAQAWHDAGAVLIEVIRACGP